MVFGSELSLRKKIQSGLSEPLIGTIVTLPVPEISEILSNVGYDWLFIDLEHSALSLLDASRIMLATNPNCYTVIRLPDSSETSIKRSLDLGPSGILIPQVNSASQMKDIIRYAKYPPDGCRSVGIGRAHSYGLGFSDYVENSNSTTAIIPQIEHIDAVNNIESIVDVEGIDAIFIGKYDLSASLNVPGKTEHPKVIEAIDKVKAVANKKGIVISTFTAKPESVAGLAEENYKMIVLGIDTMSFSSHVKGSLEKARNCISR